MTAPRVVAVALPVPIYRSFDYLLPDDQAPPMPGVRLRVPFGRRSLIGMVVAAPRRLAAEEDVARYKTYELVLDAEPLADQEWLQSLHWAAAYYHQPLGELIAAALPAALRQGRSAQAAQAKTLQITSAGVLALASLPQRAHRLRATLQGLTANGFSSVDAASRRRLLAEAWAVETTAPLSAPVLSMAAAPELTAAQQQALDALRGGSGFSVSLLQGVTGSGKTELYLQLAADALLRDQQVLVLCPEIGLTPQLMQRFIARFGRVVMGFHSGMGDSARAAAWRAVRSGAARVLVGTRSAVFAPFCSLGLVVVDEEHDASYKQQDGVRYHARDLALVRAKACGAQVVLGSATPALETLANANAGRYQRVLLSQRITEVAAAVPQLIDINQFPLRHGLSEPLVVAITRHLQAGGQALLFINRRGYAPTLLCESCHWIAPCPRCDARLNLHRGDGALRCHHCGYSSRPPRECPSCGGHKLLPVGEGAERVEEALKNHFPGKRVERFDTDRMRAAGRLEALLEDVHARRIDVLVGTQMLAKGHDFPGLSLVAVVNADQALFSSDFRAIERLGQLLTQVAGRAGRSDESPIAPEVYIQTREPKHPALKALLTTGYPALAATLLRERAEAGLPPSAHLALLRAEATDKHLVDSFLSAAKSCFPPVRGVDLLGPVPAPMQRRDGRSRAQLLLSSPLRPALQKALSAWLPAIENLPGARRVRWSIDVDPVDLF